MLIAQHADEPLDGLDVTDILRQHLPVTLLRRLVVTLPMQEIGFEQPRRAAVGAAFSRQRRNAIQGCLDIGIRRQATHLGHLRIEAGAAKRVLPLFGTRRRHLDGAPQLIPGLSELLSAQRHQPEPRQRLGVFGVGIQRRLEALFGLSQFAIVERLVPLAAGLCHGVGFRLGRRCQEILADGLIVGITLEIAFVQSLIGRVRVQPQQSLAPGGPCRGVRRHLAQLFDRLTPGFGAIAQHPRQGQRQLCVFRIALMQRGKRCAGT